MSYLLLVDTVRALHAGVAPNFTTNELFIKMPMSSHSFHQIYTSFAINSKPLPWDLQEADGVLLLVALLSDMLAIRASFRGLISPDQLDATEALDSFRSPFVPFSPQGELERLLARISKALELWSERFLQTASQDVLSLFYFCKVCENCPDLSALPRLVGYAPFASTQDHHHHDRSRICARLSITDEALSYAWLVIENVNSQDPILRGSARPIWLPVVTFLAALVVWAKLERKESPRKKAYGTMKVLGMFKIELERMTWPCCADMAKTLASLMSDKAD